MQLLLLPSPGGWVRRVCDSTTTRHYRCGLSQLNPSKSQVRYCRCTTLFWSYDHLLPQIQRARRALTLIVVFEMTDTTMDELDAMSKTKLRLEVQKLRHHNEGENRRSATGENVRWPYYRDH